MSSTRALFAAYLTRTTDDALEDVTAQALAANAIHNEKRELHPGAWGGLRPDQAAELCLAEIEKRKAGKLEPVKASLGDGWEVGEVAQLSGKVFRLSPSTGERIEFAPAPIPVEITYTIVDQSAWSMENDNGSYDWVAKERGDSIKCVLTAVIGEDIFRVTSAAMVAPVAKVNTQEKLIILLGRFFLSDAPALAFTDKRMQSMWNEEVARRNGRGEGKAVAS